MLKGKKDKNCSLCYKTGHFAYECRLKQKVMAMAAAESREKATQSGIFDKPNRGSSRGRGRTHRGSYRGRGSSYAMAFQETDRKSVV